MKIIVRKNPKVYPTRLADVPNDGDMTSAWVIEIDDIEFMVEQPHKSKELKNE